MWFTEQKPDYSVSIFLKLLFWLPLYWCLHFLQGKMSVKSFSHTVFCSKIFYNFIVILQKYFLQRFVEHWIIIIFQTLRAAIKINCRRICVKIRKCNLCCCSWLGSIFCYEFFLHYLRHKETKEVMAALVLKIVKTKYIHTLVDAIAVS